MNNDDCKGKNNQRVLDRGCIAEEDSTTATLIFFNPSIAGHGGH